MDKKMERPMDDMSRCGESGKSKFSTYLGVALLLLGAALLVLKGVSPEYLDADGVLHERFFLLPMSALCFLGGAAVLAVAGIRRLFGKFGKKADV